MNHEEAVALEAADKYLLGELSIEERDAFEAHFFDCVECAADVRAGAILAANARVAFGEEASPEVRPAGPFEGLKSWLRQVRPGYAFALACAALLLMFLSVRLYHDNRELARLDTPQVYPSFFLVPVTRGAGQVVTIPTGTPLIGFSLDVPPGATFSSYECRINGESPADAFVTAPGNPPAPGLALSILVPVTHLHPGNHVLVLFGRNPQGSAVELNQYQFDLQLK